MSIEFNVPLRHYLAIDALGSSTAHKAITESPYHARYWQTARDNSTAADVGTIAHQILLEGHEDGIFVVYADDWRKKEAQDLRKHAYASGKIPILEKHLSSVHQMVDAAKAYIDQTEIAGVFGTGQAEVTVTWDEAGLPCKARPDYLTDKWHISLKTTAACAEPSVFARRSLSTLGYDFSLAFYDRGLRANGVAVQHRILTIEQQPPYGCSLIALASNREALAGSMVDRAIKLWRECVSSGKYPGYPTETAYAEANPWDISAEEMQL